MLPICVNWREELDDAREDRTLSALRDNVDIAQRERIHACAKHLDLEHDYTAAVLSVRALMFIEKFAHDLDLAFDKLEI